MNNNKGLFSQLQLQLPAHIQIYKQSQYSYDHKENKINKTYTAIANDRFIMSESSKYKKIESFLMKSPLNQQIRQTLLDSLHPQYQRNDTFFGFPNLQKIEYPLDKNQNKTKFDIEQGKIQVIIFWNSKVQESVNFIKRFLQSDLIQFQSLVYCIALQDSFNNISQLIVQENFQVFKHYFIDQNEQEHNFIIKSLSIKLNCLPHILVVDQNQQISINETYNSNDFAMILKLLRSSLDDKQDNQVRFQQLITTENIIIQKNYDYKISLTKDVLKQYLNFLQQQIPDIFYHLISPEETFRIQFNLSKHFIQGQQPILTCEKINIIVELLQIKQNIKDQIQEFFSNFLPIDLYSLQIQIKNNSQELKQIQDIRELFIKSINQNLNINIQCYESNILIAIWNYKQTKFNIENQKKVRFQIQITNEELQIIKSIKEKISKKYQTNQVQQLETIYNDLIQVKTIGDQFQPILGYYDINDKMFPIQHNKGTILIIIFIVPCKFSVMKLTDVEEDLQKEYPNQNIQMVLLSYNFKESENKLIYKIMPNTKYYYSKIEDILIQEQYDIDTFPYYVLVDRNGYIRSKGLYFQLNAELHKVVHQYPLIQIPSSPIDIILLQNFLENYTELPQVDEFCFKLKLTIETNINFSKYNQTVLYRSSNAKEYDKFENAIQKMISQEKFVSETTLIETVDIPYPGESCSNCKCELNNRVQQYYFHFERKFYCVQCAEQKQQNQYVIQDNLVFINTTITNSQKLKDIDEYRFGCNMKSEKSTILHNFICLSCKKHKHRGSRYVVINNQKGIIREGGFTDCCEKCFQIFRQKRIEDNKYINFMNSAKEDGVDLNSVMLRITQNNGYYYY